MQERLREVSDEELEMLIDTAKVKPPPPPPARRGMVGTPSKNLRGDAEKLIKAWGARIR
jgi:hypothetical protein